ncbi:MAG: hypothetical protein ACE5JU_21130 [Candidatus Binatia bacterium]
MHRREHHPAEIGDLPEECAAFSWAAVGTDFTNLAGDPTECRSVAEDVVGVYVTPPFHDRLRRHRPKFTNEVKNFLLHQFQAGPVSRDTNRVTPRSGIPNVFEDPVEVAAQKTTHN